MKLSHDRIETLCAQRDLSIRQMLREASVSPNAFYTLARKKSVVPQSLLRIAERLEVPVSGLLDDVPTARQRMERLAAESTRIASGHRGADPDNIRHTLLLLDEKPIDRLRKALRRGRPIALR